MGLRLFFFFLFATPVLLAQDLLQRYFEAVARQVDRTHDIRMDMDFDARLLKLAKVGHLTGMRYVDKKGHVNFTIKSITGDDTVKKHVIARYLAGEQENSTRHLDTAINEKNYKFKLKRVNETEGRRAHVFEISPRKNRVGLYKGELWIDEETGLPVREAGQFSKSPSPIFLKRVTFNRTYLLVEGVALPMRIESLIETRIAGKAELVINYSNFQPGGDPPVDPPPGTNQ